jgi:hypothetical protein
MKSEGAEQKLSDIHWDLKRPCDDCPFAKASKFHQGIAERTEEKVRSIGDHVFAHTCHKTDPRADCETSKRYEGPLQHCYGAIMMLLKTGRGSDLQIPLLEAAQAGKIDIHELTEAAKRDTACYTLSQFMQFQIDGLEKLARRARNSRRARKAI